MVLQSAEQPSPEVVFPSSQSSCELAMPSPQTEVFTHFWPQVGQVQSASIWQSLEQPSPLTVLPSSQASPLSCRPFPQVRPMVSGIETPSMVRAVSTPPPSTPEPGPPAFGLTPAQPAPTTIANAPTKGTTKR